MGAPWNWRGQQQGGDISRAALKSHSPGDATGLAWIGLGIRLELRTAGAKLLKLLPCALGGFASSFLAQVKSVSH